MAPTIYMNSECDQIDTKRNENLKKMNSTSLKRKFNTDAENVGQRIKRKLDNSHLKNAECHNIKRQRSISDSTASSVFSTTDSDDDYGTDSELIAIDQNKHKNSSCRYTSVTDYGNHVDDNVDGKVINDAYSNAMCTPNMCHPINIVEDISRFEDVVKKFTYTKINNSNTRLLLEIAVATFRLSKRNKEFQMKLSELQADTRSLMKSVLENPENKGVKEKMQYAI